MLALIVYDAIKTYFGTKLTETVNLLSTFRFIFFSLISFKVDKTFCNRSAYFRFADSIYFVIPLA